MSRGWSIPLLAASAALAIIGNAEASEEKPAEFGVGGYGFFGNLELRKNLKLLTTEEKPPAFFDATFIEDACLVLLSKLNRDGFLNATVTVQMTLANGDSLEYTPDNQLSKLLPRPLKVKRAIFVIRRGVLFFYRNLEFQGLQSIPPERARDYFMDSDFLIPVRSARVFTSQRLNQAVANLQIALQRKGYEGATVKPEISARDDKTGAVDVRVAVTEGKKSIVRSVTIEVHGPQEPDPPRSRRLEPGVPYSEAWQQTFVQELRTEQYHLGFPDVTVTTETIKRDERDSILELDLLAKVNTGPRVWLDRVRFEGNKRTKTRVMQRTVRLKEGQELDRTEVDSGRERLSRLGVFDFVDLKYDKTNEYSRSVIYQVKEGKQVDLSLLLGYGSYELLRGGIELEQHNIFGLAHQARLRASQSFKSSSGDYLYSVPELFGCGVKGFFSANALRREEIDFVREEYGGAIGAQRRFDAIQSDVSLRYDYSLLSALDVGIPLPDTVKEARVSAFIFDIKHDRRDNPLIPHQGYNLFLTTEFASAALGGQVDYQQAQCGGSYHLKLGGGRFMHLGLSHGADLTLGGTSVDLPFNKRFFPGGENSVRGFQQGEAAPRRKVVDTSVPPGPTRKKLVGAETFTLGNLELEQALTPVWSIVLFVDALGMAEDIDQYPADEFLYSVGGGIRFKTIVGPARLEYGYNPRRRAKDPVGTLHFSIGFPF